VTRGVPLGSGGAFGLSGRGQPLQCTRALKCPVSFEVQFVLRRSASLSTYGTSGASRHDWARAREPNENTCPVSRRAVALAPKVRGG